MADRLKGKVALITGSGGGLGAEQVRLMAKEGAKIVATNLERDTIVAPGSAADALWKRAKSMVDEVNADGGDAILLALDVSNEENWRAVVAGARNASANPTRSPTAWSSSPPTSRRTTSGRHSARTAAT